MRDFHSLLVWQRAHALTMETYRATAGFPPAEFARFVAIALGSASEVEYHILLANDLGYVADHRWQVLSPMVAEVKRMLTGLKRRLRGK